MKLFRIVLNFIFVGLAIATKKNYTSYKFVQVSPVIVENGKWLAELELRTPDIDVLNAPRDVNSSFLVLLSPKAFERYTAMFRKRGMPYTVTHNNVQEVVDREQMDLARNVNSRVVNTYASYNEILVWMDSVQVKNQKLVSQYSAGSSALNKDMRVLVLNSGSPSVTQKIWFDCGIHAREWISPATCISLIDKFVNDYNNNVLAAVDILNKYELHFMPVLNPDGYEYSRNGQRFWRKSRNVNPTGGSTCPGTDLNRNFPFQWFTGGSSDYACLDTYAGTSAGSEPETKAVLNSINAHNNWAAYLSLHSFGNWFLTGWGYTTALPADYNLQKTTGDIFAAAVKAVYGQTFTVGSSANLLYIASGCSADWAYGTKGIKHSYTIELRPGGSGGTGSFDLPVAQIPLVGEEIFAGVKALINFI